jgi:hypothetical protein
MQSIVPYHTDYTGDQRLTVRQAILCARRHGDFGRAFLPVSMSRHSRALRDWLEILYAHPNRRQDTAALAELDAHLEELSLSFRGELKKRLEEERHRSHGDEKISWWKGIIYKSELLIPLKDLTRIALTGVSQARLARVAHLLHSTRKLQANLSISARLPGFRRQAEEAEKGGERRSEGAEASRENVPETDKHWLIIRRMLTRYNWLSTRVGDDAVPSDGLVKGIYAHRLLSGALEMVSFDALVPLRQRRFSELLGKEWDRIYYSDAVDQRDLDVFVDAESYLEALNAQRAQVRASSIAPLSEGGGVAAVAGKGGT